MKRRSLMTATLAAALSEASKLVLASATTAMMAAALPGGNSPGDPGSRRSDRRYRCVGGRFGHGRDLTRTRLERQSRSYELDRWFHA